LNDLGVDGILTEGCPIQGVVFAAQQAGSIRIDESVLKRYLEHLVIVNVWD